MTAQDRRGTQQPTSKRLKRKIEALAAEAETLDEDARQAVQEGLRDIMAVMAEWSPYTPPGDDNPGDTGVRPATEDGPTEPGN